MVFMLLAGGELDACVRVGSGGSWEEGRQGDSSSLPLLFPPHLEQLAQQGRLYPPVPVCGHAGAWGACCKNQRCCNERARWASKEGCSTGLQGCAPQPGPAVPTAFTTARASNTCTPWQWPLSRMPPCTCAAPTPHPPCMVRSCACHLCLPRLIRAAPVQPLDPASIFGPGAYACPHNACT